MGSSPVATVVFALLVVVMVGLCSTTANAQSIPLPPTPAPAPAPDYVNLTHLLTFAGPFHTFLTYLESTKVIDTFQNQANNTEQGITIFVPKDQAFSSLKNPSLANLTQDQLRSLILFHAIPQFFTMAEFNNLSRTGPVTTFAGGQYTLNFTNNMGVVHVRSGWSNPKISSSVHSTDPVAVYQVDKVLLPQAIFGAPPPPSPAPAPAPDTTPAADAPSGGQSGRGSSPRSSATPDNNNVARLAVSSALFALPLITLCASILVL